MTGWRNLIASKARRMGLVVPIAAALVVGGARVGISLAAQAPATDQDAKQKEKRITAGEAEAKRLLLLMDRDQNGKVSKQEFMDFMEAEFARLDKNKDGELDVTELTQSRLHPRAAIHR
jgi:tagatose-1,6-bisphosphate aldolase